MNSLRADELWLGYMSVTGIVNISQVHNIYIPSIKCYKFRLIFTLLFFYFINTTSYTHKIAIISFAVMK